MNDLTFSARRRALDKESCLSAEPVHLAFISALLRSRISYIAFNLASFSALLEPRSSLSFASLFCMYLSECHLFMSLHKFIFGITIRKCRRNLAFLKKKSFSNSPLSATSICSVQKRNTIHSQHRPHGLCSSFLVLYRTSIFPFGSEKEVFDLMNLLRHFRLKFVKSFFTLAHPWTNVGKD